jgi:hypothetical protein
MGLRQMLPVQTKRTFFNGEKVDGQNRDGLEASQREWGGEGKNVWHVGEGSRGAGPQTTPAVRSGTLFRWVFPSANEEKKDHL